jgi:hypothetical protein
MIAPQSLERISQFGTSLNLVDEICFELPLSFIKGLTDGFWSS